MSPRSRAGLTLVVAVVAAMLLTGCAPGAASKPSAEVSQELASKLDRTEPELCAILMKTMSELVSPRMTLATEPTIKQTPDAPDCTANPASGSKPLPSMRLDVHAKGNITAAVKLNKQLMAGGSNCDSGVRTAKVSLGADREINDVCIIGHNKQVAALGDKTICHYSGQFGAGVIDFWVTQPASFGVVDDRTFQSWLTALAGALVKD